MNQQRKPLIIFEGIGASGKSTQVKLLANRLRDELGREVFLHREPTDRSFGKLVREVVSEGVEPTVQFPALLADATQTRLSDRRWKEVALSYFRPIYQKLKSGDEITEEDRQVLFMLDRLDDIQNVIRPHLASGETIVLDRYHLSTLTHGVTGGVPRDRLRDLEQAIYGTEFIAPAVTVFLDVRPEEARRRLAKRGDVAIYDGEDRMQALRREYLELISEFREKPGYGRIVVVNGEQPERAVAKSIWDYVRRYADLEW